MRCLSSSEPPVVCAGGWELTAGVGGEEEWLCWRQWPQQCTSEVSLGAPELSCYQDQSIFCSKPLPNCLGSFPGAFCPLLNGNRACFPPRRGRRNLPFWSWLHSSYINQKYCGKKKRGGADKWVLPHTHFLLLTLLTGMMQQPAVEFKNCAHLGWSPCIDSCNRN